ncbi:hypothetical protein CcCBS67573_g09818 [Chytriomyces confervae]|uniref:ATPase AAA-type core domain-containing protein n=1 Tax=Chytriomyces confervae TaxID=246404 RepID=A0A507DM54_9FUNG|nr:hypothetical protein CcCBS67573_g09818 [Chytriomyces confervae]
METVESSADPEFAALKKRLETLPLPEEAAKNTKRELGRLKRMPANMPEHPIIRKYLEWMSEMPWDIMSDVANALGRKFYRTSLELFAMKPKSVATEEFILLDEIDKLSRDTLGDPGAALLEALESEQNNTFTDHYLSGPLDLSQVLFIATPNEVDTISASLVDRMEVIQIPRYTFAEKFQLRKHLLPKQISTHGLDAVAVNIRNTN